MTSATNNNNAVSYGRKTKIATVIAMLERKRCAGLDGISTATGWQTQTVRAALTGLRKKGHVIERSILDGASRYSIAKPASR